MTMTLEEALRVADQLSPLPAVAHQALQVLAAELARFSQRAQDQLVQSDQDGEVLPHVRAMLEKPGIYILGDSKAPDIAIPIISSFGRLYAVTYDAVMNPRRLYPTVTVNGPFHPAVPAPEMAHG